MSARALDHGTDWGPGGRSRAEAGARRGGPKGRVRGSHRPEGGIRWVRARRRKSRGGRPPRRLPVRHQGGGQGGIQGAPGGEKGDQQVDVGRVRERCIPGLEVSRTKDPAGAEAVLSGVPGGAQGGGQEGGPGEGPRGQAQLLGDALLEPRGRSGHDPGPGPGPVRAGRAVARHPFGAGEVEAPARPPEVLREEGEGGKGV
mmetsp:Transcript_1842/g.6200  ORF Transcript_1842/g.6200 Transcript_1842/m.6200 type:complete len:201 (+) Transcript_1842:400-1002(+)